MLEGRVPSKKNNYRRGVSGRMFVADKTAADIDALLWQLKRVTKIHFGWPMTKPLSITLKFFVHADRQDLDNMITTMLDVLQKGGVIKNDRQVHMLMGYKMVRNTNSEQVWIDIENLDEIAE